MRAILDAKAQSEKWTLGQLRALNIIQGHLLEFEPQIDKRKEQVPLFNIKAELYRLPNFLITGLADLYGISDTNTWDKLDALVSHKVLNQEAANKIKEALSTTMQLRMRCHLHYRYIFSSQKIHVC